MISNDAFEEDSGNSTRLRKLLVVAGVVAIPFVLIYWPGCRQYPTVTSPESLDLIKLVYTACNTRNEARLSRAEDQLGKLVQEGKLAPQEESAFRSILTQARNGQWEAAERSALRFAQDQIGHGRASPDNH